MFTMSLRAIIFSIIAYVDMPADMPPPTLLLRCRVVAATAICCLRRFYAIAADDAFHVAGDAMPRVAMI